MPIVVIVIFNSVIFNPRHACSGAEGLRYLSCVCLSVTIPAPTSLVSTVYVYPTLFSLFNSWISFCSEVMA